MEVKICVPSGTSVAVLEKEYTDIYKDCDEDGYATYFVGNTSDEDYFDDNGKPYEWLDYDEAVALCGFAEGSIPGVSVLIEGNGGWAQSMISRTDFSGLAISKKQKASYKRTSDLFWKNFKRGQKAAKQHKLTQPSGRKKVEV